MSETHIPRKEFGEIENKSSFEKRLVGRFSPSEIRNIMFVYDVPKYAHGHKQQKRDSGERYVEHPRHITLILLDECQITDPAIIKAALMHDVPEDTGFLGNPHFLTYLELKDEIRYRAGRIADPETAEIVVGVTKPTGTDMESKSSEEKDEMNHKNLESVSPKALLVKMADVLHNNRTLLSTTLEKQHHRVEETEGVYLDMFKRKVLPEYPNEGGYLLDQIKLAIEKTRLSWKNKFI